ncbi:MAG: hypothetical protein AB8B83_09470 [Bdellovibrionales bacterium]
MAADMLTDMGMAEQIDTYGATLAYYIDSAQMELQGFVDDPTPQQTGPQPDPEPVVPERDASFTAPVGGMNNQGT